MIDLALAVVDIVRWVVVVAVSAFVAHQLCALIREARWDWLEDDRGWDATPGGRNDRSRLLDEGRVR